MKILIIGATHGNELLGIKLYQRLLIKHSPLLEHVDFIIGNPRAYAKNVRFIEQDLNRSYQDSSSKTYEAHRAQEIKKYIEQTKPNIVLDMHTTTCKQPNCLIIASLDDPMICRFLRASHITKLLQVQPMGDIVTLSIPVVGYEVPNRAINVTLIDEIITDLDYFVRNTSRSPQKELFVMSDKIYKSDVTPEQAATFVNFEMHPLGFVPIMTGNNSYKAQTNYLGFKAIAPENIEI